MKAAVLMFMIVASGVALAEDPPPESNDTAPSLAPQEQQAQNHYKQGKAFLESKLFDRAIAEFETAYALVALPELLFNVAQAHRLKGDTDKALEKYEQFLSMMPTGEAAEESRTQVARIIAAKEDQKRKAEEAEARMKAKREEDERQAAKAEEERRQRDAREAQAEYDRKVSSLASNRRTGYIIGASGIGALVVAALCIRQSAAVNDEIRDGSLDTAADIEAAADRGGTWNAAAWVFGVGGVGAIGVSALYLYVLYPKPKAPRIELRSSASGVGVTYTTEF